MSSLQIKAAQDAGQQVVIIQLIVSRLLKGVLSMVLGSIMVVQILAHLPLSDVNLTANVLQPF